MSARRGARGARRAAPDHEARDRSRPRTARCGGCRCRGLPRPSDRTDDSRSSRVTLPPISGAELVAPSRGYTGARRRCHRDRVAVTQIRILRAKGPRQGRARNDLVTSSPGALTREHAIGDIRHLDRTVSHSLDDGGHRLRVELAGYDRRGEATRVGAWQALPGLAVADPRSIARYGTTCAHSTLGRPGRASRRHRA